MGRRSKAPKPPTPIAPPPPVEEVDAEFIAPTMRQLAARRARRGAYITGAERKLGGKPRVSGKEASAIADKTVRELDPMKGFETPERKEFPRYVSRGVQKGTKLENKDVYEKRVLDAQVEFIKEKAKTAGVPDLKTMEEVDPANTATIEAAKKRRYGTRSQSYKDAVKSRTANYDKYLQDYVSQSTGRMKSQYRTTQLRNLGLM